MEKKLQQVCLRVPKEVNEQLNIEAQKKGMSKTGFLLMLIHNEFSRESIQARDKPCESGN